MAIDEPILPQIGGKYAITWNFRCKHKELNGVMMFKAIIKTNTERNEFDFIVTNKIELQTFETIIVCKGLAAGDGILCEIISNNEGKSCFSLMTKW